MKCKGDKKFDPATLSFATFLSQICYVEINNSYIPNKDYKIVVSSFHLSIYLEMGPVT